MSIKASFIKSRTLVLQSSIPFGISALADNPVTRFVFQRLKSPLCYCSLFGLIIIEIRKAILLILVIVYFSI